MLVLKGVKKRFGGKIYYGWVIVATMAIANIAQTAEFNPVIGVFLKPITEEFGWSRAMYAGAITLGSFLGGLVAVVAGPLLDRFGPRKILFAAFLVLGAVIIGLGLFKTLWQFYIVMSTSRAIVQGVIAISTGVVISKWFIQKRGRAIAISTAGTRVGNAIIPLGVQIIISSFGWRVAAIALGAFTWAITLVPIALFLRRSPEDIGLLPDGEERHSRSNTRETLDDVNEPTTQKEVSFTPREAMRSRAFYLVLFASSAAFFNGAGVNFNMFAYFTDQGIPDDKAIIVLTVWSVLGFFGGMFTGVLTEKIHVRWMMMVVFLLISVGVFVMSLINDLRTAYIFAIVHGLCFGGMPMLQQIVWADYFGRESQGAIRGIVTPIQMLCNALGPLAATLVFDNTGSYISIFYVFIIIYIIAALAMAFARSPQYKNVSQEE